MAEIPLRTLDLSATPMVSNKGVEQILKINQTQFQRLNIPNCKELTNRVAAHIVQYETMQYLDISGTNLGDGFLNKLAKSTLKLTHINLTECPNITAAGILTFTRAISPQKIKIKLTIALWERIETIMIEAKNSQKPLDP